MVIAGVKWRAGQRLGPGARMVHGRARAPAGNQGGTATRERRPSVDCWASWELAAVVN